VQGRTIWVKNEDPPLGMVTSMSKLEVRAQLRSAQASSKASTEAWRSLWRNERQPKSGGSPATTSLWGIEGMKSFGGARSTVGDATSEHQLVIFREPQVQDRQALEATINAFRQQVEDTDLPAVLQVPVEPFSELGLDMKRAAGLAGRLDVHVVAVLPVVPDGVDEQAWAQGVHQHLVANAQGPKEVALKSGAMRSITKVTKPTLAVFVEDEWLVEADSDPDITHVAMFVKPSTKISAGLQDGFMETFHERVLAFLHALDEHGSRIGAPRPCPRELALRKKLEGKIPTRASLVLEWWCTTSLM